MSLFKSIVELGLFSFNSTLEVGWMILGSWLTIGSRISYYFADYLPVGFRGEKRFSSGTLGENTSSPTDEGCSEVISDWLRCIFSERDSEICLSSFYSDTASVFSGLFLYRVINKSLYGFRCITPTDYSVRFWCLLESWTTSIRISETSDCWIGPVTLFIILKVLF